MVKIAARHLEKHPENPLLKLELITLIKTALDCGIVYHIESARILTTWGLILGKTSLIVPVLNARLRPEWVDEVNRVIAEVLHTRSRSSRGAALTHWSSERRSPRKIECRESILGRWTI